MEGLSFDNLMTENDLATLFQDEQSEEKTETPKEEQPEVSEDKTKEDKTAEVKPEELFNEASVEEEEPESVGSKENNKEQKEVDTPKSRGTSPNGNNVYSSFAQALKDDSLFQNLDEDTVANINDADSFREAFEQEINSRLDDVSKRINQALQLGVPVSDIKTYEGTLTWLSKLTDEQIGAEDAKGEKLRRTLIYQDYLNRGFSDEKAKREVDKSFQTSTDLDDARDALESCKQFYKGLYNRELDKAKAVEKERQDNIKKEADELKKSMLQDKEIFNGITLDNVTRKKAYEAITKPVARDDNGNMLTAVQNYSRQNPVEFRKYLGVLYALTNGFTSLGSVFNKQVNKKVKSHLSALEDRLSNRNSFTEGLSFAENYGDSISQKSNKGWRFDI